MYAPRRMTFSATMWTATLGLTIARTVAQIEALGLWAIIVGQVAIITTIWLVGQDLLERHRLVVRSDTKRLLEKHREQMIGVATGLAVKYNMDAEKVARILAETLLEDDKPTLTRV